MVPVVITLLFPADKIICAPSKMSQKRFVSTFGQRASIAYAPYLHTPQVLPLDLVTPVFQRFKQILTSSPDKIHKQFAQQCFNGEFQNEVIEQNMEILLAKQMQNNYGISLKKMKFTQPNNYLCTSDLVISDDDPNSFIVSFELKTAENRASDPKLQNATYFQYSSSKCAYLVSITSTTIQVSGARRLMTANRSMQVVIEDLTHQIDLSDKTKVAQVFNSILSTYLDLKSVQIPSHVTDVLPPITNIKYTDIVPSKYVFTAVLEGNRKVAVKFINGMYGKEAHQLLHQSNLAPQYYFEYSIWSCWRAIVMELVEGTLLLDYCAPNHSVLEAVKDNLQNVLAVLKEGSYVHGDLRSNNIIVTASGGVKVVDFDWAGKKGVAHYPFDINTDIAWPLGVQAGTCIEEQHDKFWIQQAIDGLKCDNDDSS